MVLGHSLSPEDEALAFRLGADDYLHMPHEAISLEARLARFSVGRPQLRMREMRAGAITIDIDGTVRVEAQACPLEPRELAFLEMLLEADDVVPFDLIMRRLGIRQLSRLHEHVSRLRSKLGPKARHQIITIRQVGYRLTAKSR
jgi:DNA-binding response OmpR family regulator